ncbi:MAG: HAMP domain-containing sensor histidine kinase [Phycisphaerales bacterium]
MPRKNTPSPSDPPAPIPPPPPVFDRRRLRLLPRPSDRPGFLGGMRIRKKLVFLHTVFSLALAGALLVALRPAIGEVVVRAELDEARVLLEALVPALTSPDAADAAKARLNADETLLKAGTAQELGLATDIVAQATASPGRAVVAQATAFGPGAAIFLPGRPGEEPIFHVMRVQISDARSAVVRLYGLMVLALLGVYALVAITLEVLVLPQAVYAPIRRMLAADRAVQESRPGEELIPEALIPGDELGEIMRSRNDAIARLRKQEAALAQALSQLEAVATDMRRKNHLLETARRNLTDADRLASLGMMSAGIAHELNTPLAVLKGLTEKLHASPVHSVPASDAALMLRVVGRLEKLGESLLDFARARPAAAQPVRVRGIIEEAMTLVRLDREGAEISLVCDVDDATLAQCDGDRMVQVFVNLVRNAVDAIRGGGRRAGRVVVTAIPSQRDGRPWVSIMVTDDGPGIDAAVLPRLFEPFVSTRLDSRGTGLGLAVAEGIVREHGGVLLARNRSDHPGAIFEVLLPAPDEPAAPQPGITMNEHG